MGLGNKSFRINGAECGFEAIVLAATTSLGGFLFGYDTGQISAMLLFTDFKDRFATETGANGHKQWKPIYQSLLVSLMSIGCLFGALGGAYTADKLGRRRSLTLGFGIMVIGNVIQVTAAWSWIHLMMGRFVAGIGMGIASTGVPMFQSECAPREIRGAIVSSYQWMVTIGLLVANGINMGIRPIQSDPLSWRIVIGLNIIISFILAVAVLFLPESPRWLAARHEWDGARASMARLRGQQHNPHAAVVEDDIKEMYARLEEETKVGVGSWAECFTGGDGTIPKLVYRTLLGMSIHFLSQWSGINYFFYYGSTIFQSAGVQDPVLVSLILSAVNAVMTIPGLYLVERVGRRYPLFFAALWQSAWLFVFAAVGVALPPQDNPTSGTIMIVAACMFIGAFAATWGPMAWVVIGEIFPVRTRAKQASLAVSCQWLGNTMISFLTPPASAGIGFSFGFVFAACNLAGACVIWFFLYESRNLTLENVDRMYSDPNVKPWNSRGWVPPGYITRAQRRASTIVSGVDTKDKADLFDSQEDVFHKENVDSKNV